MDLEKLHVLVYDFATTLHKARLTKNRSIIESTIPSLSDPSKYIILYPYVVENPEPLVRRTWTQSKESNFWSQDLLRVITNSTSFLESLLSLAMLQQLDQMCALSPQTLDDEAEQDGNDAMNDFHFMLQNIYNRGSTFIVKTTLASALAALNRHNESRCVDNQLRITRLWPVLGQSFGTTDCRSLKNSGPLSKYWDKRLSGGLNHQDAYDEVSGELKS